MLRPPPSRPAPAPRPAAEPASRRATTADTVPFLARLRVGRKLTLLVLLPVTVLLAVTAFAAVAQWREARTLRDFDTAIEVSFEISQVSDAVARERIAAVEARLSVGADTLRRRSEAQRITDHTLRRAFEETVGRTEADDAGILDAVRRQLHALRVQTGTGSLEAQTVAQRYGAIENKVVDIVADLEAGRPTRASGRAADAHIAMLRAVAAAESERAELAILFHTPSDGHATATAGRWTELEKAQLRAFQQTASDELKAELHTASFRAPGRAVRTARDLVADPDPRPAEWPAYDEWLSESEDYADALRGIRDRAARELDDTAHRDLRTTRTRTFTELTVCLVVLALVVFLALILRRSITRPLGQVSEGARALSDGDLSYDIRYTGRDELGDVADTFRELRVTSERLAGEIRAMNTAIDAGKLGHRADVDSFDGTWAQLLGGMNGTMASFAAAHGRRRRAERELEGIFNLSLDLLCISGVDGYFKRVNPAFERTLGYPVRTLTSRPFLDFVHEDDRASTRAAVALLASGAEVAEFENRYLRADGTERWLQWSARSVPEEGLVYAAARDVTESRRAALEQAALRRVATAVARGVPPSDVFATVAEEVASLLGTAAAVIRYEPDGGIKVLGIAHARVDDVEAACLTRREAPARTIDEVARTRCVARSETSVGAPIVVDGRIWGVVVAASLLDPLPDGAESRLADFTGLIATAIANADSRDQLTASRARVVAAGDASRRRIERDLHDGVQQRLVSLQLELRMTETLVDDPSSELARQLDHLAKGLDDTFQDLLQVARGIHPSVLSKGGLGPALRSLARRCAIPVELDLGFARTRFPEQVEVAAYYVTSESLTNAVKHARASVVTVAAEEHPGVLELLIRDDGVGGAEPDKGSGLIGLIDRVEAIGGRLTVTSPPGEGTTLSVRLPLPPPGEAATAGATRV
ncbi:PAS domain S-box protein [Streptomyces sp. DSM 3412]|uniref:histidine kinase n=1 Tax=Streptomyces gottesmaniae TaxID=3075518 RepID=A0ABU2YYE4_9ACTN|nr:PAS domain S-box protein [Streptomyces sp. DSM 3412]MDT0569251.1 PAS domain S-box protein [Streptomyces sp. DSM 3412]